MGVFLHFYRLDPLDLTWRRFRELLQAIPKVQGEFMPKDPIQMQLEAKEAALEQWKREHPKR